MKKILLFLLPLLLIACSTDEPVTTDKDVVSDSQDVGYFTLTYKPVSIKDDRKHYADIICKVNEGYYAVPMWILVKLKDNTSLHLPFSKNYSNVSYGDYWDKRTYGTQTYSFGVDKTKFKDVVDITLAYQYSEDGETKGGVYILYDKDVKCNEVLRSFFK